MFQTCEYGQFVNYSAPPHTHPHPKKKKNTWMTSSIFTDWFKTVFVPKVKSHLLAKNLPMRAVLLVDNCPAHPSNLEVVSYNVFITCRFLPPNTTSYLQPMDQRPLEVMKRHYRKNLIRKFISDDTSNLSLTKVIKTVSLKDAIFLMDSAGRSVKDTHIQKSWEKSTRVATKINGHRDKRSSEIMTQKRLKGFNNNITPTKYYDRHCLSTCYSLVRAIW